MFRLRLGLMAVAITVMGITSVTPVQASTGVQSCLMGRPNTLASAKACAPAGAQIVTTSRGYGIAVTSSTPIAAPRGTPLGFTCMFHQKTYFDAGGFTDWMGDTGCWNGDAWWSPGGTKGIQHSCTAWLPGGACEGFYLTYRNAQRTSTGWYQALVETEFFQAEGPLLCNDFIELLQLGNGGYLTYQGSL
jgi:hypothetical protein